MQRARMLGNYVQQLITEKGISTDDLGRMLGCQDHQIKSFLKGRSFATFEQMSILADLFSISVTELLEGNEDHYNATVVHCMNSFQNIANREKILDIIDDYMDIVDAVGVQSNS